MRFEDHERERLLSEGYKEIFDHPGYFVNRHGIVMDLKNGEARETRIYVDPDGYHNVTLIDSFGVPELVEIHKLVASMFIKNPEGYREVRHLDGDKSNNSYINLVWAELNDDDYYVREYSEPIAKAVVKNTDPRRPKKVYCYDTDTTYPSVNKAAEDLGIAPSKLSDYLKRGAGSIKGYHLCYDNDKMEFFKDQAKWFKNDKVFYGKNVETGKIIVFLSISAAARESGLDRRTVLRMLENEDEFSGWVFFRKKVT